MAEIRTSQTGERVRVEVRGRVFRYAPVAPKSKERRRVCVLSAYSGRMLETWQVGQPCHGPTCTHGHHTREQVDELVRDGVLRYIGKGRTVAVYTFARSWKGVLSAGVAKVMQLV